ncbi:hypothetical protein M9458_052940 [Cirrhinus mrigala]|uniref:Gypsy retrotransposon integrase-like protein 1 n=1 Tax=Cirrhinus mrigala TaxID=683832 RepID=A0ABD0MPC5_CIRMR
MATIGRVPEFDSTKEDFDTYLERFEHWIAANEIDSGKKGNVFLSVLGPVEYGLLKSLVEPVKIIDLTYQQMTQTLSDLFKPKPILIAERFRFYQRNQNPGETISDYILALKRLASSCEFGTFLDDALRDKFVCGLAGEVYHRRLLSEKDLTFKKACDTALALELAHKDTKELGAQSTIKDTSVHEVQNAYGAKEKYKGRGSFQCNTQKRAQQQPSHKYKSSCYRCGGSNHYPTECRYRNEKCHNCGKIGHLQRACKSQRTQRSGKAQYVSDDTSETQGAVDDELFELFTIYSAQDKADGIYIDLQLNGKMVSMQLDTGASLSLIPEYIYNDKLKDCCLHPTSIRLVSYTGDKIPVLGELKVPVAYEGQQWSLPLVVVEGDKPPLLGRNWLQKISLNWKEIFSLRYVSPVSVTSLSDVLEKHRELFGDGYGKITDFKAKVRVQEGTHPIFHKPRPVPYALKDAVEKELDRLERNGIISQVGRSDWAAPIVVVPKKDKTVRLCGDYKVTVNKCILSEEYPLPNVDDLFTTLAGGKVFSKIDLSFAYQQLELDAESKQYLTINTHKGLFQYHRLAYGISTAPAIFQHTMDQILQGLQNVVCFMDDILVSAPSSEEHLIVLEKVLSRLKQHGVKVKKSKCEFLCNSVEYLGFRIDEKGLHPTEDKVEAIVKPPAPTNVSELRSFLGLLNYYGKFVPNLSTLLHPLHRLLQANVKWQWSPQCAQAFDACKQQLLSSKWLAHYDPKKPLRLACDASPCGVGAVISHVLPTGEEHPIAFASRTLTAIFGVKKFHKYLYGRKFHLLTDHKPLLAILGPKSAIPTLAALRMQRWALTSLAYDYDIEYRRSSDHANADALSRLPCDSTSTGGEEETVFQVSHLDELPVCAKDIATETRRNPLFSKVLDLTLSGWPSHITDEHLKPFYVRKDQLSTDQGCILWGSRVIIPPKYRERLLSELHEGHPGIVRMKALARGYLWWPGLDQDIQDLVSKCTPCELGRNQPPSAPLYPWSWATTPWERIHIDYAEIDKQHFLLIVDAHSKWVEIFPTHLTNAEKTINILRHLWASYGFPKELVSDNGPPFTSWEFGEFLRKNGVRHVLSPPYHPATNGQAERVVQIFKKAWERLRAQSVAPHMRLARFLLTYRNTPHTVTERTPAELFLKRQPRIRLTLLKPDTSAVVVKHQAQQKKSA